MTDYIDPDITVDHKHVKYDTIEDINGNLIGY